MNGGKLTLGGDNSAFGGSTIISNGVLALAYNPGTLMDGTLNGTTNIFLAGGAVLDVSGRSDGDLPLISGQTLSGGGTIKGSIDTLNGGTVSPGLSIGTLTVTNNVTLGGNIVMELNRTAAQTSDKLIASAISLGGTLTVMNLGPNLRAGDTFHLFNAALSGSFAAYSLPNYYAWNTSNLGVDGTLTVTAVSPPILAVTVNGGNVNFSATNGVPSGNLLVLSSTNLTLPLSTWTPVDTNVFDPNGVYGRTIPLDPTVQRRFYVLQAF